MANELSDAPVCAPSEAAVVAKVTLRLIPFLFLLYVINILDRANIGIARLQMVDTLHILSEEAYALGAGIFYVGYLVFEVPSNLMLSRLGARTWIARILMSWGVISACMMFVTGPWSFAMLRVLLGVAEAGFFPGIILYLSQWFPARERARAVAIFMAAGLIAGIVGNPISGAILQFMDQTGGLAGWQWVFLLEGIPAIVLGFVTLFYLTDRPEQAQWLTPAERALLVGRMEAEEKQREQRHGMTLLRALADPRVWLLIAVYFTVAMADNSFGFYLPTLLKSRFSDYTDFQIGFLAAVPSIVAIVGMIVIGIHSDRTGERRWHVAGPAFLAAAGWILTTLDSSPWFFLLALAVTLMGMRSMLPTFWALPTAFLSGSAAAGGIALINSVGNIGGLIGPNVIGQVKATTGSYTAGLWMMAGAMSVGGLLALLARHEATAEAGTPTILPSPSVDQAVSARIST